MIAPKYGLIADKARWPFYPLLPLRHLRDVEYGMWRLGVLVDHPDYEHSVFLVNIGDITSLKQLPGLPRQDYESLDALLLDWVVD